MKIKLIFAWYDIWVGIFIDQKKKRVYIFLLPMIGIIIDHSLIEKKDKNKGIGMCMENNCTKYATKDYNGHGHFVCDRHYEKLNNEFDEEYR